MRLLIIDGHAFAYRAFFAIRGLSSPSGQPTNAIYGFIKMLEKLEAGFLPSHTVVVWDGGLDQDRVEGLDNYKAQRDPMPDEMELQLDEIVAYLEANGIASICDDGVEADDRIGQLAKRAEAEGFQVAIDKKGANILTTIHNKLVNTHTEDLKHLWKIFHAAGEDWTVPSENWEGVSWGYFTGDDEAMKIMVERIYEQMQKVEVKTLLWPE